MFCFVLFCFRIEYSTQVPKGLMFLGNFMKSSGLNNLFSLFFSFFIRYFLHLHFKCYPSTLLGYDFFFFVVFVYPKEQCGWEKGVIPWKDLMSNVGWSTTTFLVLMSCVMHKCPLFSTIVQVMLYHVLVYKGSMTSCRGKIYQIQLNLNRNGLQQVSTYYILNIG